MTPTRRCALLFFFCSTLPLSSACGPDARPVLPIQATPHTRVADPGYSAAIDSAQKIASGLTTESPAIAVAVAVGDTIVWSAAFGFTDLERKTPATAASRFRAYSLSKGLTASTAIALRDAGKLDIDAPINTYVGRFRDSTGLITPRLLAGHLGGIRHYRDNEALWARSCRSIDEALDVFRTDRLENKPGENYLYSSWGYVVLSGAVQAAAKTGFEEAVRSLVIEPAGMTSTDLEKSSREGLVTFYEPNGNTVVLARTVDNSCKWGAGAYVTTADDMARFGAALLAGRIVASASVNEMLTPMKTASGVSTEYGMGFGVTTDSLGQRRVVHSGSAIGGRAVIFMLPDDRVVVAIMSNVEGERLTAPASMIARLFRQPQP